MKEYDYLVVGAGLFGATFAEQMHHAGKKVLVIERNNYLAGLAYTKKSRISMFMCMVHTFFILTI